MEDSLEIIHSKEDNPATQLLKSCAVLLSKNELVDCTIACFDGNIQAHKLVLAATSQSMSSLFTSTPLPTPCTHPIILLRKFPVEDVQLVLQYIYTGMTTIPKVKVENVLKICDELEYKALTAAIIKARSKSIVRKSVPEEEEEDNNSPDVFPASGEARKKDVVKKEVISEEDEDEEEPDFYASSQPLHPNNAATSGRTEQDTGNSSLKRKRESDESLSQESLDSGGGGGGFRMTEGGAQSENFNYFDNESGDDENEDDLVGLVNPEDLLEIGGVEGFKLENGENQSQQCPWCNESFNNMALLQKHLRTHVNKYRPYSCDYCHNSFARSAHLKRHLRVHTGEKPYICSICQRAFARQDKLKGHMERHVQHASRIESLNASSDAITITSYPHSNGDTLSKPCKGPGRPSKVAPAVPSSSSTFDPFRTFEIGSTTSNGLSISFATSTTDQTRDKGGNSGITVTPARTSYIQNIPNRGSAAAAAAAALFTGGDKRIINRGPNNKPIKPFNNYIVNYNN